MTAQLKAFQEADAILASAFVLLSSTSIRGDEKRLYFVADKVGVHLDCNRGKWTRIAVVYERRPGVWFDLGDLYGTPEYEATKAAFCLHESGRRSDIDSDLMIVGFARIVVANAKHSGVAA